jgi:hypothetical protein
MSIILGSYSTLRCKFNKDPPHENNINRQFHQSEETGSVLKHPRMGRPKTSDTVVEDITQPYIHSPRK